jgi:hypothetical protein
LFRDRSRIPVTDHLLALINLAIIRLINEFEFSVTQGGFRWRRSVAAVAIL